MTNLYMRFLRFYWEYVYNMEIQRGLNLESLYLRERMQINAEKKRALQRLRELGVEELA